MASLHEIEERTVPESLTLLNVGAGDPNRVVCAVWGCGLGFSSRALMTFWDCDWRSAEGSRMREPKKGGRGGDNGDRRGRTEGARRAEKRGHRKKKEGQGKGKEEGEEREGEKERRRRRRRKRKKGRRKRERGYFVEPGGSLARQHYDKRFFKDEVAYEEHRFVLRDLIRSYLSTLREYRVETWLAHGTLLGWWWNGQIMPWDYDLDVQVSNNTMYWLGNNLNRTEHEHNATSVDGKPIVKKYMLDVNPHHVDITRGDGRNIIDARWIDMTNGMFIDITALRERDGRKPGFWSCKNNHNYATQDLWPMRITDFEGVKARIPNNFEQILRNEYKPKALEKEEHSEHVWNHEIKEWVKKKPEDAKPRIDQVIAQKQKELEKQGRSSKAAVATAAA
ncbi:hypothetical protein Golomagni_06255 [Golovinomyces magnicellulatus]|nr:hypothetical protein Golomagni_06255 [Golovinomyces magnicellulatus]